jgi:fumarate hydratase, class I
MFETATPKNTPYKKLTGDFVSVSEVHGGKRVLHVAPQALTLLAKQAMIDIAHLLRPAHLQQLANILKVN